MHLSVNVSVNDARMHSVVTLFSSHSLCTGQVNVGQIHEVFTIALHLHLCFFYFPWHCAA